MARRTIARWPALGLPRGYRLNKQEQKELMSIIDHSVTPNDGDALTYDQTSGKYVPGGVVQAATVPLSSADLLTLHTTPVILVPAQGAGKSIVPIAHVLSWHAGDADYTYTGTHQLLFGPPTDLGDIAVNSTDVGVLIHAQDTYASIVGVSPWYELRANGDNQPWAVGGNSALANGNGTLDVMVAYLIV